MSESRAQEVVDVLEEAGKSAMKEGVDTNLHHVMEAILRSKTGEGEKLRYMVTVAYATLEPAMNAGLRPGQAGLPPFPGQDSKNPSIG